MILRNLNHKPRSSVRCWHQSRLSRAIRPAISHLAGPGVKAPYESFPDDVRRADARPEAQEINKVLALASRIADMPLHELQGRYHDLVDKLPDLASIEERFELERIAARLDAEDIDASLEARNQTWERERTELLDSIEDLLFRLRDSRL